MVDRTTQREESSMSSCIVCGAGSLRPSSQFKYYVAGEEKSFRLFVCSSCGFAMRLPRLEADEDSGLYEEEYYFLDPANVARFSEKAINNYNAKIRPHEGRGGVRLLEIGCSRGFLLAAARARKWDVQGLDVSAAACRLAHDEMGLPVFCGTLESFVNKEGDARKYDLIAAFDVIEHIADPVGFLTLCGRLIAPGGTLLIEFPNVRSFFRRTLGKHWVGFNLYHISFFTKESLAIGARRAGLEVRKITTVNNELFTRREMWRWMAHPAAQWLLRVVRPLRHNGMPEKKPEKPRSFDVAQFLSTLEKSPPEKRDSIVGGLVRRLGFGDQMIALLEIKDKRI